MSNQLLMTAITLVHQRSVSSCSLYFSLYSCNDSTSEICSTKLSDCTSCPKSCIFCAFKALLFSLHFPLYDETTALFSIQLLWFLLQLVVKGSLNEYGCLFQLFSSQWPPERKDSLLRMACTRNKNKKQKHKSFDHTKLFAPLSIAWIVRAVYGSKLASKWRKEHFHKRTGRGCPVTLPLLQQSNIIFFQVSETMTFQNQAKTISYRVFHAVQWTGFTD